MSLSRYLVLAVAAISLIAPRAIAAGTADPSTAAKQYTRSVMTKIGRNWNPIRASKPVTIRLGCKIRADGSVSDLRILKQTEERANELRALAAVKGSAPFPPPPHALSTPLDMDITLECPEALHLTPEQAVLRYGPEARALLREQCSAAKIAYPPKRLTLVALKEERLLLMLGGDKQFALLHKFPLVTFSGTIGPKLREGDLQIPEGIYQISGANAWEMLSLALDYPNPLDRVHAAEDHRTTLGGNILIHGGSVSTGCLVISNADMQELFVAVHDVGFKNTRTIIAPCDLTKRLPAIDYEKQPKWLPKLYAMLKRELFAISFSL